MIIALLADANSSHTQKWVGGIVRAGHGVRLFSLADKLPSTVLPKECLLTTCGVDPLVSSQGGRYRKLVHYVRNIGKLRRAIAQWRPDVVHAHYLTSYGFLGCWCGHRNLVISAWGSDVLEFPQGSGIRRGFVRFVAGRAGRLTASSKYLADALEEICRRDVQVVPFGVDTEILEQAEPEKPFPDGSLVIGTIKAFEEIYGIETLIDAFILLKKQELLPKVKLLLVGDGRLRLRFMSLVAGAGLSHECFFPGKVPPAEIAGWHQAIDIFVAPSRSESFGVSLVEAMACGKAIIASDIPAFREVLGEAQGGAYFKPCDREGLTLSLRQMINSPALRQESGRKARQRAAELYNFNINLKQMTELYEAMG